MTDDLDFNTTIFRVKKSFTRLRPNRGLYHRKGCLFFNLSEKYMHLVFSDKDWGKNNSILIYPKTMVNLEYFDNTYWCSAKISATKGLLGMVQYKSLEFKMLDWPIERFMDEERKARKK